MRTDSQPTLLTLGSSSRHLSVPSLDGDQVSITTFKIPETVCAADPEIDERFDDVVWALGWGLGRHGESYNKPLESELSLSQKIESAAREWFSVWVVREYPKSSAPEKDDHETPPYRRRIAFINWGRPEFETVFKARRNRHAGIVSKRAKDIRGLDKFETSADAKLQEEKEGKDLAIATQGFWRPITETWEATFEEHHVSFSEVTSSSDMAGKGSWLSCPIQ